MPTYTPTIVVSTTPNVSVTMVGTITYQEFLNILGIEVFSIKRLILSAGSFGQIREPYAFSIYDSSGIVTQEVIKPRADPYQAQPVIYLSLRDGQFTLNGQSTLSFNILPNENLTLELDTQEAAISDLSADYNSNIAEYKKYADSL